MIHTVISTASELWTPHLRPCHKLDWLYTVSVTNKVEIRLTIYRSVSASLTMENHLQTYWYFSVAYYHQDQGESLNNTYECTELFPPLISTASGHWMSCFRPCYTLYWLYTVPATNKVDGKMTIYCSGLSSFTIENHLENAWYFSDWILPWVNCYLWFELKPKFCKESLHIFETEILQRVPPLSSLFYLVNTIIR